MDKNLFRRTLRKKLIIGGVYSALTIGLCVGVACANAYMTQFEGFITSALCSVKTSGSQSKSVSKSGEKLAVEIEQEGIVLAQNNDDILPLAKSTNKVNVFGHSVVDWLISNSGSGSAGPGTEQKTIGLLDALQENDIEYNTSVIDYYKSWCPPRSLPFSIQSGYESLYRLADPSLSNDSGYQTVYNDAKSYSDTAFVCISRVAGEHIDVPHQQINKYKAKKTKDTTRGYLELTTEEEELLRAVGQDFDKVVVIINASNVIQCDFLKTIPGLDACLIVGPTGTVGARAVPQVIWGDVNPSGRTADTYPMNQRYNVTYYTNGYQMSAKYTSTPSGSNLKSMNSSGDGTPNVNFADYIEGIYVGYRWFETADAEGFWDQEPYNGYDNVVAYPFGHGLSYTSFSWEVIDSKPKVNAAIAENDTIEIQVKVTNTGDVAGRDVVEAYLTAPYTPGGIEKSFVKLVGFKKTPTIQPGKSIVVPLTLHTYDFTSYDCYDKNENGHTGYELEAGEYQIKLMENSHVMKENMPGLGNTIKYNVASTINIDKDYATDENVKNLFTGDDAVDFGLSCDGSNAGQNINYITRENFAPLLTKVIPNRVWNKALNTSQGKTGANAPNAYSKAHASSWDNATGNDAFGKPIPEEKPTWGVNKNLKVVENGQLTSLGRILANDYDAPEWEDVLNQTTIEESMKIVNNSSSYNRPGIKSCGLGKGVSSDFKDAEGASQVGVDLENKKIRLTAYPTPTVQAQCWNSAMPYSFGKSEAKDMAVGGIDALYGPASNIHRSPYGGRNSEYHSEDPFLAGATLAAVTRGLSDGGKTGFIKHFAVNDTEYHRVGLYTWLTEQALREIYLRPFEEAVKRGEATAVMSSFNRVGATWAGGSEAMIQGVLRNEWGFKGMIITDMIESDNLMDISQHFRAGANYVLGGSGYTTGSATAQPNANSSARLQWRIRENAKQVIYAHIRVLLRNEVYNANPTSGDLIVATETINPWVWWKPARNVLEALAIVGAFYGLFAILWPGDPEFRKELFGKLSKKKGAE